MRMLRLLLLLLKLPAPCPMPLPRLPACLPLYCILPCLPCPCMLTPQPPGPWPLPSLGYLSLAGGSAQTSQPWRQPSPTLGGSRAGGAQGGWAGGQNGRGVGGRREVPATGPGLEFMPGAAMVRSLPCSACGIRARQFEFDLGGAQEGEGGKTRQTGGRCLILRLCVQAGGLPCRLPPAACRQPPACQPQAPDMHHHHQNHHRHHHHHQRHPPFL